MDDDLPEELGGRLRSQNASIEVLCLEPSPNHGRDEAAIQLAADNRRANISFIRTLISTLGGSEPSSSVAPNDLPGGNEGGLYFITNEAQLLGHFRTKEVTGQGVKQTLEIGSMASGGPEGLAPWGMGLRVKVVKKNAAEKIPSLKTRAMHPDGRFVEIQKSVDYFLGGLGDGEDIDKKDSLEPVPAGEVLTAARYGKQVRAPTIPTRASSFLISPILILDAVHSS